MGTEINFFAELSINRPIRPENKPSLVGGKHSTEVYGSLSQEKCHLIDVKTAFSATRLGFFHFCCQNLDRRVVFRLMVILSHLGDSTQHDGTACL